MRKNLDLSKPHFDFAREEVYYRPSPMAIATLGENTWTPPQARDMPSWRDAKVICLDVETRDEQLDVLGPGCRRDPRKNYVCGVAMAIEDGPAHYLPIRHDGGDNCDWDVMSYLRGELKEFRGTLVFNEAQYDMDWLANDVPDIVDLSLIDRIDDVQVRDPLLYELHLKYNLDSLCERYGLPGKDEVLLRQAAGIWRAHPKKELWRLPAKWVAAYGIGDVRRPLQVRRRQIPRMQEEEVEDIWKLEKQVTLPLVRMRRHGMRIDLAHLETMFEMCRRKQDEHLNVVRLETGVQIDRSDVWKAPVLAKALKKAGYDVPKTAIKDQISRVTGEPTGKKVGGKDSVDQEFLKNAGKVGKNILRARKWNKLADFCRQVEEQLIGDRVHCTINQLKTTPDSGEGDGKGVRYGRFSMTDFNAQQMPIRDDEFGELFRQLFIADEGALGLAASDWSQQEPRIGVHYAEIIERITKGRICRGAKDFADEYRRNPKLDVHQKLTDEADDPVNYPRKIVKNYVNGRLYGMGDVKLCHHLGWSTEFVWNPKWNEGRGGYQEIPTRDSAEKIARFVEFAPWIPGLTQYAADQAREKGFVWTFLRRKLHFERGPDGKWWKIHKAFNRVGQGSAADQMKATLVACFRAGVEIQWPVHDEFVFSYRSIREALTVRELQESHVKFSVPMNVDLELGPSWGKLIKYDPEIHGVAP